MTKIKKVLGMMMAALMCLALTPAAAFATDPTPTEPETGTITIGNAVNGETYKVYRILDLVSYNNEYKAYTYKVADGWDGFFAGAGVEYVSIDPNTGDITWKGEQSEARASEFAKAALEYASDSNITANDTKTVPVVEGDKTKRDTVEFTGLKLGYYVVDSSLGTLCSLNTTKPNVDIREKNDVPSIDKKIVEGDELLETNDAAVGAEITFQTTVTGQPGAQNYVVHDKMTSLQLKEFKGITWNGTTLEQPRQFVYDDNPTDGCTFEVTFTPDFCKEIKAEDKLVITYTATLLESAIKAGEGTNDTYMEYGDASETVHKTTHTKTWDLPIFKYTGQLGENGVHTDQTTALKGANFTLYKVNGDERTPIALADGSIQVITPESGYITFQGLDSGLYELVENAAPAGFNKLSAPVSIEITADGKIKIDNDDKEVAEVTVLNNAGAELPSTGGMGTTILYVVGGILVIAAIAFLVVRRRSSAK